MLGSLVRFFAIVFRERPIKLKLGARYRVTLDLSKVRPGMHPSDVANWLMSMAYTPTTDPAVWKSDEEHLRRLPKGAIIKAQKL